MCSYRVGNIAKESVLVSCLFVYGFYKHPIWQNNEACWEFLYVYSTDDKSTIHSWQSLTCLRVLHLEAEHILFLAIYCILIKYDFFINLKDNIQFRHLRSHSQSRGVETYVYNS